MRYFYLAILLVIPAFAAAQLTAPGVHAVRYTSYPSAPSVKDPVFIWCNDAGTQKGTLAAASPKGSGPFNFTWYQWSDASKSFSTLFKTDPGVANSTATNLGDGGYKVLITGGYDTSLVGWVFVSKPSSSAKLQNRTCDYVALNGEAAADTFFYRNPVNGLPIKLPNGVAFMWSSDPASSIPEPDFNLDPITFDPPLTDVTYNLQVTDSFGCLSESSFFYQSIHVKADFTLDPVKGEAPLAVTITDKSVRGSKYLWQFGENKDSISYLMDPPPHIYYKPGEYQMKLTIESDLHCIDSMTSEKIKVDPSDLQIPNVFTPDGDGLNDYFVVESTSIRQISVEVYSRSGLKVYEFNGAGEDLRDWKGWDGNVNHSSRKASPGVYFYIIRAYGWDDKIYDSKEQRGFVYLYR